MNACSCVCVMYMYMYVQLQVWGKTRLTWTSMLFHSKETCKTHFKQILSAAPPPRRPSRSKSFSDMYKMHISLMWDQQGGRRHLPLHNASGSEACKRSISKAACCFAQHLRRSGPVMCHQQGKNIYFNVLSYHPLRLGLTKIAKTYLRPAVNW